MFKLISSKVFLIIIFVFILTLFSLNIQAKPRVNITKNYYNVKGKTVEEIGKNLTKESPIIYQGKKYHAYTAWNVKWHFYWYQYPNSCQISSVNTTVDVKYTLPKLIDYSSVSPSVKQKWDRYYSALINHENGHKNFGINSANKIENAILNMGKRNTCQLLEKDANNLANQIIKSAIEEEKQYDIVTNHGAKQGAIFP